MTNRDHNNTGVTPFDTRKKKQQNQRVLILFIQSLPAILIAFTDKPFFATVPGARDEGGGIECPFPRKLILKASSSGISPGKRRDARKAPEPRLKLKNIIIIEIY